MLWNEEQSPRVKKDRKPACREESGVSVFSGKHMDNVQKETHVVSVMTNLHKDTCAVVRDKKRTIVFSCTQFEGQY